MLLRQRAACHDRLLVTCAFCIDCSTWVWAICHHRRTWARCTSCSRFIRIQSFRIFSEFFNRLFRRQQPLKPRNCVPFSFHHLTIDILHNRVRCAQMIKQYEFSGLWDLVCVGVQHVTFYAHNRFYCFNSVFSSPFFLLLFRDLFFIVVAECVAAQELGFASAC